MLQQQPRPRNGAQSFRQSRHKVDACVLFRPARKRCASIRYGSAANQVERCVLTCLLCSHLQPMPTHLWSSTSCSNAAVYDRYLPLACVSPSSAPLPFIVWQCVGLAPCRVQESVEWCQQNRLDGLSPCNVRWALTPTGLGHF